MSLSQESCAICLALLNSRAGDAIMSPGCCGKFFHQKCIDELQAAGKTECPHCRAQLPVSQTAATLPRQNRIPLGRNVRQQVPQRRSSNSIMSIFGFGSNQSQQPIQAQSQFVNQQSTIPIQQQTTSGTSDIHNVVNMKEEPIVPNTLSSNDEKNNDEMNEVLPVVTLSTSPEYTEQSLEANNNFHVRVNLKYEDNEILTGNSTPLDLMCILDNSGSMTGSKIQSLIKAMEFVIDNLSPKDRLSIVHFNSKPGGLHGLLKMTGDNKEKSKRILRQLRATGGTNIYKGMEYGWTILNQRTTFNPATCIFLLTDGQDRSNVDMKKELAQQIKLSGISLFVFGFGRDHDSEHMDMIASSGEGLFTYIEQDDMVIDAFGGAIGTQQGISLKNIQLSIDCCEHHIEILEVMSGRYISTITNDKRHCTVQFVNLYMGESRDIILKISLPQVSNIIEDYHIINAITTYQLNSNTTDTTTTTTTTLSNPNINNSSSSYSTSSVPCTIHRYSNEKLTMNLERDLYVDIALNRNICMKAIEAALSYADTGNFGSAKEIIANTKAQVITTRSYLTQQTEIISLIEELDDALTRVQSRADYDYGGRAMMQEAYTTSTVQRGIYTKSNRTKKYQSSISSMNQEKACKSKSGW